LECQGVAPDAQYGEILLSSYLALKKDEGSYQSFPKAVRLASSGDGTTHYRTEFVWPKKGSQGSYRVEVYACRGGSVTAQSTASFRVTEVGFPAWMANLAGNHSWTYSLLAVVATLLAGFGIDAVAARLRRPKQRSRADKASPEAQPAEPVAAGPAQVDEKEHAHHG
jgi:hypothetical protein